MSVPTKIFLGLLGVTIAVWLLRGVGMLTFLPGIVIWVLVLLTIAAGVVSRVYRVVE
ncbi:MAG: hypothetical protein HC881_09890 [Leptolyngbyaceae cyanobacterium SL_7_1]|nr:hypothetical protein [Leptolyngbyaceae cyanobacterium SL_7_1]